MFADEILRHYPREFYRERRHKQRIRTHVSIATSIKDAIITFEAACITVT